MKKMALILVALAIFIASCGPLPAKTGGTSSKAGKKSELIEPAEPGKDPGPNSNNPSPNNRPTNNPSLNNPPTNNPSPNNRPTNNPSLNNPPTNNPSPNNRPTNNPSLNNPPTNNPSPNNPPTNNPPVVQPELPPVVPVKNGALKNVVVYGNPSCGYCIASEKLLKEKGISYEFKNVFADTKLLFDLHEKIGPKTFPYVFIDDKYIGGFNELKTLLDKMVKINP